MTTDLHGIATGTAGLREVSRAISAEIAELGNGELRFDPRNKGECASLNRPRWRESDFTQEVFMNSFVDLAVLGKPEALEKFLPAVEALLPQDAYRDLETEKRVTERSPGSRRCFIRMATILGRPFCFRSNGIRRPSASTRCCSIRAKSCPRRASHHSWRTSSTGSK